MPADPTTHGFEIVRDEQRKRGWYLSWRCQRKDCDARGNGTLPSRTKALALFDLLDGGHCNGLDACHRKVQEVDRD